MGTSSANFDAIKKGDPSMNSIIICRMNTLQSIPAANILKTATAVESLYLKFDSEVQTLGLASILYSLIENKSLNTIVVCQQSDDATKTDSEAISKIRLPIEDDLNILGSLFGIALQLNQTIREIKLVNCKFINETFFEPFVHDSIRTKTCMLTKFSVVNCNIGDSGTIAVAQALVWNQHLKELCLSKNNITDIGAIRIAEAVRYNNVLIKLGLSNNPIGESGIYLLVTSLKYNRALSSLYLNTINTTENVCKMLEYQFEANEEDMLLNYNHFLWYNSTLKSIYTDNYFNPRFISLHQVLKYSSTYRQALATKKGFPERSDKLVWLLRNWVCT
jgi:Leucine Rich repeat